MAGFGELVLVLGDLHIPQRANAIPEKFKRYVIFFLMFVFLGSASLSRLPGSSCCLLRMLVPNKMQHVICTGNVGYEQYEELQRLAPNLHMVAGEYDLEGPVSFPETRVVQVGSFRIGVLHGHQVIPWNDHAALGRMRRKLNVDILISGHTHQNEVVEQDGYYHINPVSRPTQLMGFLQMDSVHGV